MIITDVFQIRKGEICSIAGTLKPDFAIVKSLGLLTEEEFPDALEEMPWNEGLPVWKIIFGQLESVSKRFRLYKNTLLVEPQTHYKIVTYDDKYEVLESLFYAYSQNGSVR